MTKNNQEDCLNVDGLSDEELNKILECKQEEIPPEENTKQKKRKKEKSVESTKKINLNHLLKNKKPVITIKDQIKKEIFKAEKEIYGLTNKYDTVKRTPDKIIEKPIEKEKIEKLKFSTQAQITNKRADEIRHSKDFTNEPLKKAEKKKILIQNELIKNELEKQIKEKRTIYNSITTLRNQEKECNCIFDFSHFQDNILYSKCRICSCIKEWSNINEWYRYNKTKEISKNDT